MHHPLRVLACAVSAVVLCQPVTAELGATAPGTTGSESASASVPAVRGEASAGAVAANGSTESQTYTADLALELEYTRWRYAFETAAFVTTTDGVRSGERYATSAGADYKFGEGVYWLLEATREHDRFGAFARRTVVSTGLGREIEYAGGASLELRGALGRRVLEPQDTDERQWQTVQRLSGLFEWPFSESGGFDQELLVEVGGGNAHIESTSALRSSLTDALAWRVSYVVRHNSEVPAGRENTDNLTTFALEYAY